jgi:serine/threonine protein kinase
MSSIVSESTTHARRPPVVSDPDNNELPSGEVLFPPLHPDNLVQNRDRVLEALRGIEESSIDGLRFSLSQDGPLYQVTNERLGHRKTLACIEELDPNTASVKQPLIIKRLESFTSEGTRLLPPGFPGPDDGSELEARYMRAISRVRGEHGLLDYVSDSVLSWLACEGEATRAAEIAESLRESGGVNDPLEVHRARRSLREIAAQHLLSRNEAAIEAYPGIVARSAPRLHEVYLQRGENGAIFPYLVMERVPGISLATYLEQESKSVTLSSQVLDICLQLLQHGKSMLDSGVAHCDSALRNIVASSVLVNGESRPLVRFIDFGFVYLHQLAEKQGINGFADCDLVSVGQEYDRPRVLHAPLFSVFKEILRFLTEVEAIEPKVVAIVGRLAAQHEAWFPMQLEDAIADVKALQEEGKALKAQAQSSQTALQPQVV